MSKALREPVNIVSKYLRSSPARPRPPGSPKRHHGTRTSHYLVKHDIIAMREEQEESDSDIEVFGPFPGPNACSVKGKGKTGSVMGTSVNNVNDKENNSEFKSLHPLFLENAVEETSTFISRAKKPPSRRKTVSVTSSSATTSQMLNSISSSKYMRRTSKKLAELTSSTSAASVESEPSIDLPVYSYKDYTDPKCYVVYTRDVEETDDLIGGLRPGPVAFDMEWCFTMNKFWGSNVKERRTAVVQIADTAGLVIIVHLAGMARFPKALQALLENPNIPKMGANILNDGKKLFRDYGVFSKNLLELGALAAAWDPTHKIKRKIISLAKLAATYCSKTLVKGDERTSNWEASELSELQKDYAANDVHCSMEIYKRLRSLAGDATLDPPAGTDVGWSPVKDVQDGQGIGAEMRLQWRRAHKLWYERGMELEKMCVEMRVKKEGIPDDGPLKSATVISYVIYALQADPKLPFDIEKLRSLVQMDATSWSRHRAWLIEAWFRLLAAQQRPVDVGNGTGDGISVSTATEMATASTREGSL